MDPYKSPRTNSGVELGERFRQHLRTLQVVTLALLMGVVLFTAVILVTREIALNVRPGILGWIGLGVGMTLVLLHASIPPFVSAAGLREISPAILRESKEDQFAAVFPVLSKSHMISCALLEAATFLNLTVFMMQDWIGNLIAAIILIFLLLQQFPTTSSTSARIQHLLEELSIRRV